MNHMDERPPAAPAFLFLAVLAPAALGALIAVAAHPLFPAGIGAALVAVGAWLHADSRDLGRYVFVIGVGLLLGAAAGIPLRDMNFAHVRRGS
jgi:hypothetical protein